MLTLDFDLFVFSNVRVLKKLTACPVIIQYILSMRSMRVKSWGFRVSFQIDFLKSGTEINVTKHILRIDRILLRCHGKDEIPCNGSQKKEEADERRYKRDNDEDNRDTI